MPGPGNPKYLKPWKPGQSGNPKGRPPLSKAMRAFRELTLENFQKVVQMALSGTPEELKELASNPDTPALQVGLATAVLKAIKNGDPEVIERFAERIIGKIPLRFEHTGADGKALNPSEVKIEIVKIKLPEKDK